MHLRAFQKPYRVVYTSVFIEICRQRNSVRVQCVFAYDFKLRAIFSSDVNIKRGISAAVVAECVSFKDNPCTLADSLEYQIAWRILRSSRQCGPVMRISAVIVFAVTVSSVVSVGNLHVLPYLAVNAERPFFKSFSSECTVCPFVFFAGAC